MAHHPHHVCTVFREVDGSVTVGVNFVDFVLNFFLGRDLPNRTHEGAQLLGGDFAVIVLVDAGEPFLEPFREHGDLLFGRFRPISPFYHIGPGTFWIGVIRGRCRLSWLAPAQGHQDQQRRESKERGR